MFSFAIVADTHVNESDSLSTSPFETNHLANERARYVFQEIAGMEEQPDFVVHLGDIVHPVPGLPTFDDAVGLFKDIAAPLSVPLHVIPGNHDIGDKRVNWMPADQICDDYVAAYREAFGSDYYAFDHGPLRLVMMNSLLLNSGLADEATQRQWLESEINNNQHQRVFVFMHYPPYIYSPDERGNYDNVDMPARAWLVELLSKPNVEAVFAGHVHNYWYDAIGRAEFYMLPSTAFLRHDFAEFYKIAPAVEFARGDVERFGYFKVDVFDDGHVAYSVKSLGGRVAQNESLQDQRQVWLAHPKSSAFSDVGMELRHPWAETMQITSTGGVQEFGRKWARNDYPLLALTEMGVRLCKVPDIDVVESESRQRMSALKINRQEFIVTSLGAPRPNVTENDLDDCGVVAFEVNATGSDFERDLDRYTESRKQHNKGVYFAKILANDESRFDGKHFTHFVKSGFLITELEQWASVVTDALQRGAITGITIRHEADDPLLKTAMAAEHFAQQHDCEILISIKLAGPVVSQERARDRATAVSAAQAMVLSRCLDRCRFVFDTFMDVDRGYYPRHGFIDGRFNARTPAMAFTAMNALLSHETSLTLDTSSSENEICFSGESTRYRLVSGNKSGAASSDATDTVVDLLDHLQLSQGSGRSDKGMDEDRDIECRLIRSAIAT